MNTDGKHLDIKRWNRRHLYEFFKAFDEPFTGVTVEIDCSNAYGYSKKEGISFFLLYLHRSLVAANRTEAFLYRIKDDGVFVYDVVNASATINRENGTFGFSYMAYYEDFRLFEKGAQAEIEQVRNSEGLFPAVSGENVIHYSSIPWLDFTSLSHARNYSFKDSSPKISFGMMKEKEGRRVMPVSIHVHHALMDGFHVGQFVKVFQDLMNEL